jgi:short-subunit dehydrogenase
MPASGVYSGTKALLSVFLESLAIDLAGSGVRAVR